MRCLFVGALVLALVTPLLAYAADDETTLNAWQPSFHDVWQADSCVQEFQSWKRYWGWVHVFYFGGNGFTGWFAFSNGLLAHVTDPTANTAVAAQLTSLGRRIGGEWAKDSGCRKIRNRNTLMQRLDEPGKPGLDGWENQLTAAAKADSGNGETITAAIKPISDQLDKLDIAAAPTP